MPEFKAHQKTFSQKPIRQGNLLQIKTLKLFICLLLILVTFVAFWQVRNNEFINLDDNLYVADNPHVKGGLTLRGVLWAFTTAYAGHWHPVTWLSHMLDVNLFGLHPGGHHLTNLFLHITVTLLVFILLQRMTGAPLRSGFVAGLFALHPLHVESVAWVAERKDLLCAFFWMLTIWAYHSTIQKKSLSQNLLVLLCFVLALMSKPMAVTLPFVLLLIDYWPLGRLKVDKKIIFRLVLEKIPLFSLTAVFSLFTILTHLRSGAIASVDKLPLDIRIGNALLSYVKYMAKMFWPDRLAILYPHPIDLPFGEIIGATFLLMVITVMVILVRKRHPYLIMGWFWYLGTLVPVIGLVQAGVQAMADRFTYIPLIGLWVMMVYGISEILSGWRYRRTILLPSGILILFILTIITMRQVNQWQNSIKLFTHTLAITAPNPLIHNNLGVTFMRQGKDQEALDQFRKALKIRPNYADAHSNLGFLLTREGKDQEAMAHFVQALQMKPENAEAHHALGVILTKQGKRAEAVVHLSEAVRINPHYEEALYNLGTGLLQLGRVQEAIYYFNQALRINPNNAKTHHNLGLALASLGKTQEAISHYEQSLRTNPESADAHFSLASLLKKQGRDKDALFHFKEALRMNPSDGRAHYELGTILFRQGINEEAVAHLVEAVRIIPNDGEAHLTLGMVYLGMGKKDLALTEYKILKTINPNLANTLYQNISKASH